MSSWYENKIPNHCSIDWCPSGYKLTQVQPSAEVVASFHYSLSKSELLQKWIKFTNWKNWTATAFNVIGEKHFHEDAMSLEKKRVNLKWKWDPIPTKHEPPFRHRLLNESRVEFWQKKKQSIKNVEPNRLSYFQ